MVHNRSLTFNSPTAVGQNSTFTEYQIDRRKSMLGVVQFHHVPLIPKSNVLHQKKEIRQAKEAASKPSYFGKEAG